MNNTELKTNIVEYLRDKTKPIRTSELAKLFGATGSQVNKTLENASEIIIRKVGHHTYYFHRSSVDPSASVSAPLNRARLKGEWKPDTAMKIAMTRCRESRGDELHTLAMTGGERMFNPISGV